VARRALISVTDKTGAAELGRGLERLCFSILSTGGTARALVEAGVHVTPVEAFTGFPEMLDGRVKTLHPKVFGGILARRDLEEHRRSMDAHGLEPIDVVAVNLYDFGGAVARPGIAFEDAIEQIDIGGPSLLRAAAKNHDHVYVVTSPADYPKVLAALEGGSFDRDLARRLALDVFRHTARYDVAIAEWLGARLADDAVRFSIQERALALRYGENPHQTAALYRDPSSVGIGSAEQLQGKELSYNNLLDLDAAMGVAADLPPIAAVYIKHNNPSGAARGRSAKEAIRAARDCDALSAFGAVVALNVAMDGEAASVLTEGFVEAVVAPGFRPDALEVLAKKKNIRVMRQADPRAWQRQPSEEHRGIRGGSLVQARDAIRDPTDEVRSARVVTRRTPTETELEALAFTWVVAKHVRSNAIVFGAPDRILAVGAGQMSRVDSVRIAKLKNPALRGSVVASDAFFPFRDGVDEIAAAGATAIAQPGGSVRDDEVIRAADDHGMTMVFTGVRHFRH
jgi:phosphoribosylaminoimidazolecarboxamide formyltransferase/IMP cyclohydrolase